MLYCNTQWKNKRNYQSIIFTFTRTYVCWFRLGLRNAVDNKLRNYSSERRTLIARRKNDAAKLVQSTHRAIHHNLFFGEATFQKMDAPSQRKPALLLANNLLAIAICLQVRWAACKTARALIIAAAFSATLALLSRSARFSVEQHFDCGDLRPRQAQQRRRGAAVQRPILSPIIRHSPAWPTFVATAAASLPGSPEALTVPHWTTYGEGEAIQSFQNQRANDH